MHLMAPREESWTDEPKLREELGEMRAEIKGLEKKFDAKLGEVRAEISGLEKKFDAKFDGINRTMQIGFGIVGGVMTAMLGLLGLIATKL